MTPDLKRLYEAAERAHDDWVKGGYSVKPGEYTIEATPEAIVRAVLMALREPSAEMIDAGAIGSGEDSENVAEGAWECMIDAILAEPAKA
ncbi:hypothetical protein SB2_11895 [Methylobacterium radiotolerans]|nr:hypothetical protein SB3_11090 [Methylobacterium radiotolerans]KTS47994.1 hypothetical protein SB2_11895 [Methylobacterium radiotolerans]